MGSDGHAAAAAQDGQKKRQKHQQHNGLFVLVIVAGIAGGVVARVYYEKSLWSSFKWALLAAYLPSYLDQSFWSYGRCWPAVQRLSIWKSLCGYFSARVVALEALDSAQQYIIAAHPHGLGTWNHFVTMTDGAGFLSTVYSHERRDLAATVLFAIPLLRELLLWLGCVDAGAATASKVLKAGYSTLIYVGGEQEQILTTRGKHILFLHKRKGFIRLSLKFGVPVVPLYAWGENDLYYTLDHPTAKSFQLWLADKCRIAMPPQLGCWWNPWWPRRRPLTLVLGKPLNTQQPPIPHPTKEQVDALHALYVTELRRLFDLTKDQHGHDKDAILDIR